MEAAAPQISLHEGAEGVATIALLDAAAPASAAFWDADKSGELQALREIQVFNLGVECKRLPKKHATWNGRLMQLSELKIWISLGGYSLRDFATSRCNGFGRRSPPICKGSGGRSLLGYRQVWGLQPRKEIQVFNLGVARKTSK